MEDIKKRTKLLCPDQGEETFQKLVIIINQFKRKIRLSSVDPDLYSEKDIVLICYADHVREDGVKTLRTIHSFLKKYVKGYVKKIHFLPFYPYSSDDGFSVIDYYKVKDEFGDWDDIEMISKDFGLMFDLVVNHVSQKSMWFQQFLKGNKEYENYFIAFDKAVDISGVFRPRTHPLLSPFKTKSGKKYVWTTFSGDQIDLNFQNPEVLVEIIKILLFYIEHGAEVIRLDAIAYLWKQLGTSCIHLPQVHEVVKLMRSVIKQVAPHVWIITETNVPHKDNISYFGNGNDEAHLVYNFALPPLLLLSFLNQDATALTRWADTLKLPSGKTTFFNFTASHDGIGVTPLRDIVDDRQIKKLVEYIQTQQGRVNYRAIAGTRPQPYELNIVYLNALGGNIDAFLASQAIALTMQGVPAIYFNSLIGETNWAEGIESLGYNRAINRRKFSYQKLQKELEDVDSTKHKVYSEYTRLLKIRINEPLFSPHADQKILSLSSQAFSLLRFMNNKKLLVIINIANKLVEIKSESIVKELGKMIIKDLISGKQIDLSRQKYFTLMPYQILWAK